MKSRTARTSKKHEGISFEMAALIFEDERCLLDLDRIDETGEQRWHAHRGQDRRRAASRSCG
jgi:uncharacterized DUF497 family protein